MGRLHYLTHELDAVGKYGDAAYYHGMHAMYENGVPVACHEHLTREFGRRARDFMTEAIQAHDPYFCMVAFNAVHNFTWQLPEEELAKRGLKAHPDFDPIVDEYVDWYDGAISPNLENGREYYLAQLEMMDEEIGRLLDLLEETETLQNTLVIYLTDNGGSACNFGNNAPLTGSKYTLFEGGVRVPYLASWPQVIPAGSGTQELTSSLDLLPTFAYVAGAQLPNNQPIDGVNLFERFSGVGKGHDALFFDTGFQWSVRTQNWKLHEVHDDENSQNARKIMQEVEHTDIGCGRSLFSLRDHLAETPENDCLSQYPDKAAELAQLYHEWYREIHQ